MGQPRGPQRMFARGNNAHYGAPNDDNFVTTRDQPRWDNGHRSGHSWESHRNRRGHASISSETTESTGNSIQCRNHQERQKPASTNKLCKKAGLGRYQSLLRTILVQHPKPTTCPRGLPPRRWKNRNSITTTTDSTWQSSPNPPGIGSHVGFESSCLVPAHPSFNCANGIKLQTLHRAR